MQYLEQFLAHRKCYVCVNYIDSCNDYTTHLFVFSSQNKLSEANSPLPPINSDSNNFTCIQEKFLMPDPQAEFSSAVASV